MNHLVRAALAATLALSIPALANEPTTKDPNAPKETAGKQETDRPTDDAGLKADLNLDDATAERVATIVTSAKDQAKTLRQQMKTAVDDLRRAREANDAQATKTALDRLRGLHNRLNDLETETVDRVFANLTLQQQADFALWMADKKKKLVGEAADQA